MGRGVFRSLSYNNQMNLKPFFQKICNLTPHPATLYLLFSTYAKKSTKKRRGMCSKFTIKIKTSERHQYFSMFSFQWDPFDIFVNFKQISHLGLEFIMLVLV